MDLGTCISNKFPGDVDAAGREHILRSIALELILAHRKACSMSLNKSPFCGLRLSLFCALGWGMARLSYFISKFPMSPALFRLPLPHLRPASWQPVPLWLGEVPAACSLPLVMSRAGLFCPFSSVHTHPPGFQLTESFFFSKFLTANAPCFQAGLDHSSQLIIYQ